jgi:hypothetical protein
MRRLDQATDPLVKVVGRLGSNTYGRIKMRRCFLWITLCILLAAALEEAA